MFLNPTYDDIYFHQNNPFKMKNMSKSVKQIIDALHNDDNILIIGDYDADGVTSTALLYSYLKSIGAKNLSYRIPLRHEGYGLSKSLIDYAKSIDTNLIITVDNGIIAKEEVEYAKLFNISVCISDHHEPQGVVPDTLVLNPKQADCPYYNKDLSGCGVVYKLIQALSSKLNLDDDNEIITDNICDNNDYEWDASDVMDDIHELSKMILVNSNENIFSIFFRQKKQQIDEISYYEYSNRYLL
jgi:single-stranded-DNA-specific exonuclease